jgi:hypothetical protein
MTVDEVLSIGYDTLDDKYVRMLVRMLCTYYYLDNRSDITHKMINAKDILPLYRSMTKYRTTYYVHIHITLKRFHTYLLAILCYSILRSRFKNRECSIDRSRKLLRVSSGNMLVYLTSYTYGLILPWTKVCASSMYISTDIMDEKIAEVRRCLYDTILESGSDIKILLEERSTYSVRETLVANILFYKSNTLYRKILPEILCVDNRKSTHFSEIPDISMFR